MTGEPRPWKSLVDPREDPRDSFTVPDDEDGEATPDEAWAFEFDTLYRGCISRTPGGRDPRTSPFAPAKKRKPWAARGGECERLLLSLGLPPVRGEVHTSLWAAVSLMLRDSRSSPMVRDLVREYLLGLE